MNKSSKQSVANETNILLKVQTFCIVIATIWGIYTFVLKEIIFPNSAPVNIIVDLQLRKIGPNQLPKKQVNNRPLIAVEMAVSVTNPSSRVVYLLPSVWIARGFKINSHQLENSEFIKKAIIDLNSSSADYAENHVATDYVEQYASTDNPSPMLMAAGRLLIDQSLKPYEKVSRKIVFHVQSGNHDLVKASIFIPTMTKKNGADVKWVFEEKLNTFVPKFYRIAENGERTEINKNEYQDNDAQIELQSAVALSALSLW